MQARLAVLVAVAIVTVAVVLLAGSARRPRVAPQPVPPLAMLFLNPGQYAEGSRHADRYRHVVLRADEHHHIASIRAASPGTLILVYKNAAATSPPHGDVACPADWAYLSTGVGYCEADSEHPEWFLTDQTGQRIRFWHEELLLMDMGDPAYRDRWRDSVLRDISGLGFDGVWVDDVNIRWAESLDASGLPAAYPTDAAMRHATEGFLERAVQPIRDAGHLVFLNIGGGAEGRLDIWGDWIRFGTGVGKEHFGGWGDGPDSGDYTEATWRSQMEMLAMANAEERVFVAITYGPGGSESQRKMRFARASLLLGWQAEGVAAESASVFRTGAGDPWAAEWTIDLGRPQTDMASAIPGSTTLWQRSFDRGSIVVNAGMVPATAVIPDAGLPGLARKGEVRFTTVPAQDAVFFTS